MPFPMTGRGGGVHDPSKKGYDPRGLPSVAGSARRNLFPTAPVAAMAPLPVQFATREQRLSGSDYGGVSRFRDDENKTGVLGGSARRRGAARALLG